MKKEQIPENPIDRFFYKIVRGAKNVGVTIKKSRVVKTFLFLAFLFVFVCLIVWGYYWIEEYKYVLY